MLTLGLTGGIGAGKSTVARRLAELGAVVVDADRLAREVVARGTPGLAAVVAEFGAQVLTSDGDLDRPALGRIVFADAVARRRLEVITHPLIAAATAEAFASAPREAIGVHDVPLLVERQMGEAYHLVLVVHVDLEERVRRLVTLRGMPEADVRARITAQADDAARRAAADVWLDNSGSPEVLTERVDALWQNRIRPFADNLASDCPAATTSEPPDAAALDRVLARLHRRLGEWGSELTVTDERTVELALAAADAGVPQPVRSALHDAGFAPLGPADGASYRSCDPGCALDLVVVPT